MKKIIVASVCLMSGISLAATEHRKTDANGLTTLKVASHSGDTKISVSKTNHVEISADKIDFEKSCKLTMKRSGSDFVVKVTNDAWIKTEDCKINFDIKVPKTFALDLKSGSGDIVVNGTKGEIEVKIGSGNVKIDAEVTELEAKTGSGNVEVSGLVGKAEVKTGSGDVQLTYKTLPKSGDVEIKTGSGNATVYLPESSKIMSKLTAGSGRVYNEIGDDKSANVKVSLTAGSGNLNIKKL